MPDYSTLMGMLSNQYSDPQKNFLGNWYGSLAKTSDSFDLAKAIRDKQQEITNLQNKLYNRYLSPKEEEALLKDPEHGKERQADMQKLQQLQAELAALQSGESKVAATADEKQNFGSFMNPFGPG